jgi:hypothetical protein
MMADTLIRFMAGLTGLEPATSSVTGWHSNRLSYNPSIQLFDFVGKKSREKDIFPAKWWAKQGSNL